MSSSLLISTFLQIDFIVLFLNRNENIRHQLISILVYRSCTPLTFRIFQQQKKPGVFIIFLSFYLRLLTIIFFLYCITLHKRITKEIEFWQCWGLRIICCYISIHSPFSHKIAKLVHLPMYPPSYLLCFCFSYWTNIE